MTNVKEVKKLKARLMFDDVLITATTMKENKTESGIIIPESSQKELMLDVQEVILIGPAVDQVKPGEKIVLKVNNFMRPKLNKSNPNKYEETMEWVFPIESIDGEDYMLIKQRDIKFVLEY